VTAGGGRLVGKESILIAGTNLNGAEPWTQWLQIARTDPGGATRVQLFNGAATFPTRAEAVAACVELGRDILDRKVPDQAVLF